MGDENEDTSASTDDVEQLKAALAKANDDAKRHRLRNRELEPLAAKVKELEDAGKTELEKLRSDLAERDAQIAELPVAARRQAVRFASEAARQGFLDPEDAFAFLPSDVDLDDHPAIKKALEGLAERKPHLVRTQPPAPKVPARPKVGGGEHIGSPGGDNAAKERAAAALRALRQ